MLQQYDDVCANGCSSETPVLEDAFGFAVLDVPTTTLRTETDPVTQSVFDFDAAGLVG